MFMILIYNNKLDVVLLHRLSTTDFHNLKETFEKLGSEPSLWTSDLCGCEGTCWVMHAGMQTGIMIYFYRVGPWCSNKTKDHGPQANLIILITHWVLEDSFYCKRVREHKGNHGRICLLRSPQVNGTITMNQTLIKWSRSHKMINAELC